MKKALLVTTISGFVPQFEMNNVKILQGMGYEVHYASNFKEPSYGNDNSRLEGTGIITHQIDFVRSPYKIENWKIYYQLKNLMSKEHFDLIHCHTPMGGVMARLAAHHTKTGPVIYTAHGFHFFKGAPLKNWLLYYPIEKFLSRYTDQLICINKEDYQRAKRKFHAKKVTLIPGVGIDVERIQSQLADKKKKRKELGIPLDKFVILSVGEMTKNKNHALLLRAMAEMKEHNIYCLICGKGEEEQKLKKMAVDLEIEKEIVFLGFRMDIYSIYPVADVFVFPSLREGMPVALMEAMASGLPVICSDIRGNRDLVQNTKGGILLKGHESEEYSSAIKDLVKDENKRIRMGNYNQQEIKKFEYAKVTKIMERVYQKNSVD